MQQQAIFHTRGRAMRTLEERAKDVSIMHEHRESFKKSILENKQVPKFIEMQFLNMLKYMENNERLIAGQAKRIEELEKRNEELHRLYNAASH